MEDGNFTGTKICGTIGPSCQSPEALVELLEAGMVAARFDLTWAPLSYHRKSLDNLQLAMKQTRRLCATMVDTLGRELMIRRPILMEASGWPRINAEAFEITAGDSVAITTRGGVEAGPTALPITYTKFPAMCEKGDYVYIGRYLVCGADSASLYMEVTEVTETDVICRAQNDAVLDGLLTVYHVERSSDQLLNLQNDLPLLSDYDKECLAALAQDYEIDFLSLSYTRNAEDVREARSFLRSIGAVNTQVYAKLETRQALLNFKGILAEADGIIISRGNLGLDCVPEKMALIQKTLIQSCNLIGKPVVITRVVDTMINTPRPTRAEATDVANAVLDGADGILLGAETLRGKYAVETVQTVVGICKQAEKVFDHHYHFEHLMDTALEAEIVRSSSEEDMAAGADSPRQQQQQQQTLQGAAPDGTSHLHHLKRSSSGASYASLNQAIHAMTKFGAASTNNLAAMHKSSSTSAFYSGSPYLSKLESIASSAVRAAEKVAASLIVVYTHSGKTASLVAKYRPPMPILTLVVPRLVSDSLRWKLEGRHNARQCLMTRGLLPMLAAPSPNGDAVLEEAILVAAQVGLVKPHQHVVCVQRIHEDFCVKIVSVDALGAGIKRQMTLAQNRQGDLPMPAPVVLDGGAASVITKPQ